MKALALWNLFIVILFTSGYTTMATHNIQVSQEALNLGSGLGIFTIIINLLFLAVYKDK